MFRFGKVYSETFQTDDRDHHFRGGQQDVGDELPIDIRAIAHRPYVGPDLGQLVTTLGGQLTGRQDFHFAQSDERPTPVLPWPPGKGLLQWWWLTWMGA